MATFLVPPFAVVASGERKTRSVSQGRRGRQRRQSLSQTTTSRSSCTECFAGALRTGEHQKEIPRFQLQLQPLTMCDRRSIAPSKRSSGATGPTCPNPANERVVIVTRDLCSTRLGARFPAWSNGTWRVAEIRPVYFLPVWSWLREAARH
jgi:hypothetical protein